MRKRSYRISHAMLEPFEGGRRCQLTSTSAVKFLYGNNSILYKCIVNLYIRFLYLQNISAIFEKIEEKLFVIEITKIVVRECG